MKRRNFIRTMGASALALPLNLNGLSLAASGFMPGLGASIYNDKILILITLSGGNDGLNTVIPLDQYGNLSTHRSGILIPEAAVLNLTAETGFHPAMGAMHNMYNNGEIAVVQGVGYPNFNRSHFRATDILYSGSDSQTILSSGWLGRYFQTEFPNYPNNYPNGTYPDPFALTIGNTVSKTCQGSATNFSLAMNNPFNLNPLATGLGGVAPAGYYGDRLTYVRNTISQTNDYATVIQAAANTGTNTGTYPDTALGNRLKTIANLISGGLQTKVYAVGQGGYDTHGSQTPVGSPTTGKHADLLTELSDAIAAFQADMSTQNLQDKTMGLVHTEFGRRIIANGANGTDHGDAGPMIIFGSEVTPGIVGSNPTIPASVSNSQGIAMQYDFKDVYKTLLENWICADNTTIQNDILFGSYTNLGATGGPCAAVLPIELLSFEAVAQDKHIGLMWEIGIAEDLDGFWLQRSEDGIAFTDYKWVMGHSAKKVYEYKDTNIRHNQPYYYRLKQVEVDGSTSFSLIRTAMIGKGEVDIISIYPNPAQHRIHIKTTEIYKEGMVLIMDRSGKPVFEQKFNGGTLEVTIGHLADGMYTVQVFTDYRTFTKKFMKIR